VSLTNNSVQILSEKLALYSDICLNAFIVGLNGSLKTIIRFWDVRGVIFIDYLKKGHTINSEYYIALLERLAAEIAKKRPHMAKKKKFVLSLHRSVSQVNQNNDKTT